MAIKDPYFTGLDKIQKNLNKAIAEIKDKGRKGTMKAGFLVMRRSIEITPHRTGNLKGSSYIYQESTTGIVEVGYQAEYAPDVHETNRNYRVGGWKFLERALKRSTKDVLRIIAEEVKIK